MEVDHDALTVPGSRAAGSLTETFVHAELTRLLATSDLGARLHFYRDRDAREIDFVLERRNGDVVGIEVKASSTVGSDDFRHLRWLADRLGDRFVAGYVLHLGQQTHRFGERMAALPVSALCHHAPL
nr:DUF4143 domain-containing protein [Saccharomonospora halophila]